MKYHALLSADDQARSGALLSTQRVNAPRPSSPVLSAKKGKPKTKQKHPHCTFKPSREGDVESDVRLASA